MIMSDSALLVLNVFQILTDNIVSGLPSSRKQGSHHFLRQPLLFSLSPGTTFLPLYGAVFSPFSLSDE